jgi:hypothetical protein
MKDELFGEPLVILPEQHKEIWDVELHPAERLLYVAVLKRLKSFRKKAFKKGDPRRGLLNQLAQLTRLRQ